MGWIRALYKSILLLLLLLLLLLTEDRLDCSLYGTYPSMEATSQCLILIGCSNIIIIQERWIIVDPVHSY